MSISFVLLPLFVQVILTFVLMFWMAGVRRAAVVGGEVRPGDIALRQQNWPAEVTKISNAYHNQLELPLLFYVLTILAIITRHADLLFVLLAWVFVVLRILHAAIHVTTNSLGRRFMLFAASAIVLAIMWGIFMLRILLGL